MDCTQCGEETKEFHEGYCLDCCEDNQKNLDNHNFEFDAWNSLSNEQRENRIIRGK